MPPLSGTMSGRPAGTRAGSGLVTAGVRGPAPPTGTFAAYPSFNFDQLAADIETVHALGVTAEKLSGSIVGSTYLPFPPAEPIDATTPVTVNSAADFKTNFEAGGKIITIGASMPTTAQLDCLTGSDNIVIFPPGRRVNRITFSTNNPPIYGDATRCKFIGGEVSALVGVWGGANMQDLLFDGMVINLGVHDTPNPVCAQLSRGFRIAFANCVMRAGPGTEQNSGFLFGEGATDLIVANCNLKGTDNATGTNNWCWRSTNDNRAWMVDCFMETYGQNCIRHAYPTAFGAYTTQAHRADSRRFRYVNEGFVNMHQNVNLGGVPQKCWDLWTESFVENNIGDAGFGIGGYTHPFQDSLYWAVYGHTMHNDQLGTWPVTAQEIADRESAQSGPEEWYYANYSVVDEVFARPTPPTIFSQALSDNGYTGGQPAADNSGTPLYTSDPDALPTV